MIKAIETEYKGYRFRSRLEARWAVFFDTLGIAWEYEKEGYDLGEAGWYLPDFWLPKSNAWLEIKPDIEATRTKGIKVFCAGKVGNHNHCEDWRYELLVPDADFYFDTQGDYLRNPYDTALDMIGGYKYVGPFSYDECGGHASGNPRVWFDDHSDQHPELVVKDCQHRIAAADVVFAWIDSDDCFGTLVEIGYAAALKKEIWIGHPEGMIGDQPRAELWYVLATANKVQCANSALEAFATLHSPGQWKRTALARHSKKQVYMLQGNPWPHEHKLLSFNADGGTNNLGQIDKHLTTLRPQNTNLRDAYAAARSARFEHGEHGTR